MYELYQLRQLVAVAEYGTLSAAAEAMHVSQPALTRSMQKLEEELSVKLFERKRNKIVFNDVGLLAVEYARRVVDAMDTMTECVQSFARKQTTISIGSCAPGPMWVLTPEVTARFPEMTITSELREQEILLNGLKNGQYQLIVLDHIPAEPDIIGKQYVTEQLHISLPPTHPLAAKDGIYLSELAGQTMLLYSDLGVWNRLRDEKMQDIRFIVQTDREAFADLISASVLPNFSSNLTENLVLPPIDRVQIPILDPEATIIFYICTDLVHTDILDHIATRSYRPHRWRGHSGEHREGNRQGRA